MNLTKEEKQEIKRIIKQTHAMLTFEEGQLLYSLAKNNKQKGVIVEIGSYKGGSAILLAKGSMLNNREKVYTIDPHKNSRFHKEWRKEKPPPDTLPFLKKT